MTMGSGKGVVTTDVRGMDKPMYVLNDEYAALD